jgi:hypothetical protein
MALPTDPAESLSPASYRHTQAGPLCWLLYALGGATLAFAWLSRADLSLAAILLGSALLMLLLASSFHHLRVEDRGEYLEVAFGPLPLFRRTVPYANIRSAEPNQTTLLDGLGVHFSLRGGWCWNIWGRDCVLVRLDRSVLRIGTDDPQGLANFLNGKLTDRAAAGG